MISVSSPIRAIRTAGFDFVGDTVAGVLDVEPYVAILVLAATFATLSGHNVYTG